MKSEFALIETLKKKIPRFLQGAIGIGDDTGVILRRRAPQDDKLLFTTDSVVDGVDFISKKISPELAGRKALAINLSDLAAMGGEPLAFVVGLGIPKNFSQRWIEKFYTGLVRLAREYKVLCVGGDISRARQFFACVALIGSSGGVMVRRGGAKRGDWIGVSGNLGGSILGRHASFIPRIQEGKFLARGGVSSMLDISDGLLQDLGHICRASKVGAKLDTASIPVSKDAFRLSQKDRMPALHHALSDGEDFELLFTISAARKEALEKNWKKNFPKVRLSWIGRIVPGKNKIRWLKAAKPIPAPALKQKGFTHF